MGGGGGLLSPVTNVLFGKPNAPAQPAVPDYTSAAQATAQGNLEAARAAAAANRVNQVTPYGNLNYEQTGTDSYGNPTWTATQTLSPDQQAIYQQDVNASKGLGTSINAALGRVQQGMENGFNPNLPSIQYGGQAPTLQQWGSQAPTMQNLGQAEQMSRMGDARELAMVGQSPEFARVGDAERLQSQLQNTGMAGWDRAQAILNQRLQPQLQMQQEQLDTKLRSQGIMPGTEAYNRAKSSLGMQQNDLINQSQLTAQGIGQNLFNQELQAGQFGNSALTQQQQNQLAATGFNNSAAQQAYANQLQGTQQNNAALTQQQQTQLANQGFNNTAAQQNFANQATMLNQNNANAQQNYTNRLQDLNQNNAIAQQNFANQNTAAGINNQAQQQAYTQAMTNYNMPLNTLSALRSGAQVTNPNYVNVPQQATTTGADILGATQMGYNAQMGQYNAGQAAQANQMSGLLGLGGQLGGAYMLGGGLK